MPDIFVHDILDVELINRFDAFDFSFFLTSVSDRERIDLFPKVHLRGLAKVRFLL